MTHGEVSKLNLEWLERVGEINRRYGTRTNGAADTLSVHMVISVVGFILEEEVGPHNAVEFVERKIREFEEAAHRVNPRPKGPARRRGPKRTV